MKKEKTYSRAPLPFVGQKRMFVSEFKKILKHFDDKTIFVDLFGGSGLLSHITKRERPDAVVIYNDHDNYRGRLENIGRTNTLLGDLRKIVGIYPRHQKITGKMREAFLERIRLEETTGFVDYLTLSTSLLFSGKYAQNMEELEHLCFYNKIRQADYRCDGYLDGLEVVCYDYKELADTYKVFPGVVFLVDPPYMGTDISTYRMDWKLGDYLDVLPVLKGHPFVYFTSSKSPILDFCKWMEEHPGTGNPFKGGRPLCNYRTDELQLLLYRYHALQQYGLYCLTSHRLHLEFFFSGYFGCRQGALFLGMSQEVQPKRHIIWKQTHARRRQLHPLSRDSTVPAKERTPRPK